MLLKYLIRMIEGNDFIVLDFFSGSCTIAHSILDLNKNDNGSRRFICVQIPERCDEGSKAFKAGFKTIADIGKERIKRVIKKIKEDQKEKLDFEGRAEKRDVGVKAACKSGRQQG